ncbi:hypothetical protein [Runella sp.]|uniref:hypothetical protein n=1 Tax=Runella sp. TaxID=1960881 RepID=UPI003D0D38F5
MLLALIFIAWVICLIFGEWKHPPRYITRAETDGLHKPMRENRERETLKAINGLKIINSNGQHAAFLEAERQYKIHAANDEITHTRSAWLKLLNEMHDKGELDDIQFNNEVNKCLDS